MSRILRKSFFWQDKIIWSTRSNRLVNHNKIGANFIAFALFSFLSIYFVRSNAATWIIKTPGAVSQSPAKIELSNREVVKDQPLNSILRRNTDVFAVDQQGLYRAQLLSKTWKKLNTPEFMPFGGNYARQPRNSKIIFYYKSINAFSSDLPGNTLGLYSSSDDGESWQLVSEADNYEDVLLNPNGDLYAIKTFIAEDDNKKRRHVFISSDLGRTWRDITNNADENPRILFIDPDRPNLICLYMITDPPDIETSYESYIMQSNDKKYIWRRTYSDEQWEKRTRENFFNSFVAPGRNVIYELPATLHNYFEYNFELVPALFSFTITSGKSQYEFYRSQKKAIKVNIIYRTEKMSWIKPEDQAPSEVKLPDQESQVVLWGIKIEDPIGRRFFIKNTLSQPESDSINAAQLQVVRSKYQIQTHAINQKQPYTRSIDLNQLYDFPIPGKYKIQLIYNNKSVASEAVGEWSGAFNGEIITVIIKP